MRLPAFLDNGWIPVQPTAYLLPSLCPRVLQVPMITSGGVPQPCGPPLRARCETDIFRMVGLSYVPPHMRHAMRDDL